MQACSPHCAVSSGPDCTTTDIFGCHLGRYLGCFHYNYESHHALMSYVNHVKQRLKEVDPVG